MAQRYMQIVREVGDPTRVSDLPVRDVLAEIAVPRVPVAAGGEPEVDAEPVPSGPSAFDLLREAGGLDEALQELQTAYSWITVRSLGDDGPRREGATTTDEVRLSPLADRGGWKTLQGTGWQ